MLPSVLATGAFTDKINTGLPSGAPAYGAVHKWPRVAWGQAATRSTRISGVATRGGAQMRKLLTSRFEQSSFCSFVLAAAASEGLHAERCAGNPGVPP